jgi:hypothetical protein
MDKRCFLAVRNNSLLKQAVSSLLDDMANSLDLFESKMDNVDDLLKEISEVDPDMILLEESSPFSDESLLVRLMVTKPGLPFIVISAEANLMHIVHRETVQLSSSADLISAINYYL